MATGTLPARVQTKNEQVSGRSTDPRGLTSFEFINTNADALPKAQIGNVRRVIRSHVTSQQRQRERQTALKRVKTQPIFVEATLPIKDLHPTKSIGPSTIKTRDGSALRPASEDEEVETEYTSSSSLMPVKPQFPLAPEKLDPFNVSKTLMDPKMQFYFQHFDNTMFSPDKTRSKLQSIFRNLWGPLSNVEPAVLYIFVASGAADAGVSHWGSYGDKAMPVSRKSDLDPYDALVYRSKAIQAIRNRMANSETAYSDLTLVSVALIIQIEAWVGHVDYAKAHMSGIKEMVNKRGGLDSLSPGLQRRVMAGDIKTATTSLSIPVYPCFHVPVDAPPDWTPSIGRSRSLRNLSQILHPELATIFVDLLKLILFSFTKKFDAVSLKKCIFVDPAGLQAISIEYRLLYFASHEKFQGDDSVEGCCRLAGLLFFNTALWPSYPPAAAILKNSVVRLKSSMTSATLADFYEQAPELLLWVLFVGAVACRGQDVQPWFISQLTEAADALRIEDSLQLEEVVKTFLYVPAVYDTPLAEIWADVEALKRLRDDYSWFAKS